MALQGYVEQIPEDLEPIGDIQGQQARSREEWRVAEALEYWEIEYDYQVPFNGGQYMRGGQVLDFVVRPYGYDIILFVQGERWHTGHFGEEDVVKVSDLEKEGYEVVEVWDNEIPTKEAAIERIRELFL